MASKRRDPVLSSWAEKNKKLDDSSTRLFATNKDLIRLDPEIRKLKIRSQKKFYGWIKTMPTMIGENFLIVTLIDGSHEKNQNCNIIAVSKFGGLILINLIFNTKKRKVEWSAIYYKSYFSNLKSKNLIKIHAFYLREKGEDPKPAKRRLIEFFKDQSHRISTEDIPFDGLIVDINNNH
jgi:hypothetical protein